jgi:carnitine 3-dehydrogenase
MNDMRHVAVLGAGLIGAGWAALFGLCGRRVTVIDPHPQAAVRVAEAVAQARPVLAALGLAPVATPAIGFVASPSQLDDDVALVQEALPEDAALKRAAFEQLEPFIAADTLIASSSSGCLPTPMQAGLAHPQRLFIAHPCNPPWLMPLVELVPGRHTDAAVLPRAAAFYQQLGRRTVQLAGEIRGHLVNRLQAALWREAVHLVASGAASVEQVDLAVTEGLGARWACCGPHMIFHLAGAERGMAGFLDNLGEAVEQWWADLGTPTLDEETRRLLIEGMQAATGGREVASLAAARDQGVTHMLRAARALENE